MTYAARCAAAIALIALASVAAGILVPGLVITVYALIDPDPDAIVPFAVRVAEPLALFGAAVVVACAAWLRPRWWHGPGYGWGLAAGLVAAAAIGIAALLIGDVDLWIVVAVVVLPAVGYLFVRRAPRPEPAASR
jgi:hypothetical protein